ncbi:DUF1045 domain-containing protein [Rhodanobacter sp. 7MK24]|uniref:DUF1045 domain-containing protein n=1 Tax=Rhodanobacter sp. 7MK24 TaxID=2775922 RepID=UPI001780ACDB|nr:DUF1045 domain-containing protein [Rhodanobacter sp. 7MK24]MBD8882143.1 DUF1045 domain-containing protein [Rhodanobacter sp. 7MK24]
MRYAVYFCPPAGSGLDALGREWLSARHIAGIAPERWRTLTANVRRYGWHATLCAPFALAEAAGYDELRREVADIARHASVIELAMQLDHLAGFLALRPHDDEQDVHTLADQCVRRLNPLRAPNSEATWQRRAPHLDAAELALFRQYGYPYVLDRYRFHMTVSAPASETETQAMRAWFAPRLADRPVARIDALTLCQEKAPDQPFEPLERIPLGTGAAA